jgi:hypothetical protein
MSAFPSFGSVVRYGVAAVSTANTNRDGTGTIVDILVAVAAPGTRIDRVALKATSDPADSIITLFLHNGTSYFLRREVDLGNPAAASTTVTSFETEFPVYDWNLIGTGQKFGAAITVALTAGTMSVHAHGADYTGP